MRTDYLTKVDYWRKLPYIAGSFMLLAALSFLPETSTTEMPLGQLSQEPVGRTPTPVAVTIENVEFTPLILNELQLGKSQSTFWQNGFVTDSSPVPVQIGQDLVAVKLPFKTITFGEAESSCVDLDPNVQGSVVVGPVADPLDLHNQELFFTASDGTEFSLGYCPVPRMLSNGEYYAVTPDVSASLGNPNSVCVTEGLEQNK